MIANYLWEAGSLLIATMGLLHLRATLSGYKLYPRNEKLVDEMKKSALILTAKSTMWKAWVGFNASHSSGAIFIGIMNYYLAFRHADLLRSDYFFALFTILTLGFYVWVAKKYWFDVVLTGISTAWVCFIVAFVLMVISPH